MAIKSSLGELDLAKPLGKLLPPLLTDSEIELLPIEIADLARVATLFWTAWTGSVSRFRRYL